jgi:hypothetical protein
MVVLAKIVALWRLVIRVLLRVPFREVWLSVALLLAVGENYPFSNFPMYSSLEEESVYFVVRSGQGETLAFVTNFRSRAAFVPKALKAERRKLEKAGINPGVASRQAGENVLFYLLERAEPQKRERLLQNGLKLVEVRISVDGSQLNETEKVLAEISSR